MARAPSTPKITRTLKDLRRHIARYRKAGETVALVPTMGALHDGHLTLVRTAKQKAQRAVVSIFVNPTQFAPNEDLARYPRDEASDLAKLATVSADLVWAPSTDEMYGANFSTRIEVEGAARGLEGAFRPHHFAGVATVCCKLFSQVTPDVAIFGEKDYQQLCVIRQMVRDLNLPLAIHGVATVREKDGLARSSRNAYLSADERAAAPTLSVAIRTVAVQVADGTKQAAAIKAATKALERAGFGPIDYIAVADAETLDRWDPKSGRPGRVLVAARLGTTRLIDNVPVPRRKT
jgi:pantoate--beta-alanine ligase